jgi:hypothetical protein
MRVDLLLARAARLRCMPPGGQQPDRRLIKGILQLWGCEAKVFWRVESLWWLVDGQRYGKSNRGFARCSFCRKANPSFVTVDS